VERLKEKYGIRKVVLNGGSFQNRILLKGLWEKLEETALKTENFYKIDIEFKENENEIVIST